MKVKGFTLIEMMIAVAIIGIIASLVLGNSNRTTCIGGFVFAQDYRGHNVQVINENGHGIKCQVQ